MVALRTLEQVLADEAVARDAVWMQLRADLDVEGSDDPVVDVVLDDPTAHPWRTVDAALDRSTCQACGAVLGSGRRGCGPCDFADGARFLGQEPDRPGVPRGNEHALRVCVAVVRNPHRWPADAVQANRLYLPRFSAGDMPTKAERYVLLAALRAGRAEEIAEATTFAEMATRARRRTR